MCMYLNFNSIIILQYLTVKVKVFVCEMVSVAIEIDRVKGNITLIVPVHMH